MSKFFLRSKKMIKLSVPTASTISSFPTSDIVPANEFNKSIILKNKRSKGKLLFIII